MSCGTREEVWDPAQAPAFGLSNEYFKSFALLALFEEMLA